MGLLLSQFERGEASIAWKHPLDGIRGAGVAAFSGFLSVQHIEGDASGGARDPAVDGSGHRDQRVQIVIRHADFSGFLHAVPCANLATSSQGHRQAHEMFFPLTESVGRVGCLDVVDNQRIIVCHVSVLICLVVISGGSPRGQVSPMLSGPATV